MSNPIQQQGPLTLSPLELGTNQGHLVMPKIASAQVSAIISTMWKGSNARMIFMGSERWSWRV